MGFLDKAKAAAEQAAAKAKEEYDDLQLKRELSQAYNALGKASYELIESGELAHEKLEEQAAKIRALHEKSATNHDEATDSAEAEPSEAIDAPEPPA